MGTDINFYSTFLKGEFDMTRRRGKKCKLMWYVSWLHQHPDAAYSLKSVFGIVKNSACLKNKEHFSQISSDISTSCHPLSPSIFVAMTDCLPACLLKVLADVLVLVVKVQVTKSDRQRYGHEQSKKGRRYNWQQSRQRVSWYPCYHIIPTFYF